MEELTKTEERVMQILWKLKTAFVDNLLSFMVKEQKLSANDIEKIKELINKNKKS